MHITYNPENNIGYIRFMPEMTSIETLNIAADANIDFTPSGKVYGIELLNTNEQIGTSIIFENQQTKTRQELRL